MMNVTIQELAETYLQFCSVIRNYAPDTIKGYQATFRLFFKESGVQYVDDLNLKVFETWFFNGRVNQKWSSVTGVLLCIPDITKMCYYHSWLK